MPNNYARSKVYRDSQLADNAKSYIINTNFSNFHGVNIPLLAHFKLST